MKKFSTLFAIIFLLGVNSPAQQSKPSPGKHETARTEAEQPAQQPTHSTTQPKPVPAAELKQTPKAETAANAPTAPALPVGTAIRMKLEVPLYTGSTRAGDTFSGRILEDVKLNDRVVVPVGASLQGHVMQVTDPRRIKGKPMIQLRPESLTLANGQKYAISAAVVDTNKVNGTDVDDEGRIKGPGHTGRDVVEIGAGTGAGAIIGGIGGGAKGSLIGAGIGAGGTIIHWLTKKNYAYLPAGSEIIFELSRPMVVEAVQMAEN